jgi:predicted DCC family thiol-disulfide oxidoreductase YuxK
MAPGVLVYDSDCGPCTDFKNMMSFLDPRRRLSFASMAEADELGLLDALPRAVRYKSFHIIAPGQCVTSGAEALPVLIGLLTGGIRIERAAHSIPFGFQAISSVYRVLSRLHDTGSCAPPGLVASGSKGASGLGLRPKPN